jgi:hypothetical protein
MARVWPSPLEVLVFLAEPGHLQRGGFGLWMGEPNPVQFGSPCLLLFGPIELDGWTSWFTIDNATDNRPARSDFESITGPEFLSTP